MEDLFGSRASWGGVESVKRLHAEQRPSGGALDLNPHPPPPPPPFSVAGACGFGRCECSLLYLSTAVARSTSPQISKLAPS